MPTPLINAIQVHAYGNADQLKLERIPPNLVKKSLAGVLKVHTLSTA
jgi:hypothetical protein